LIAQIPPELKILENQAYHRRILMYRGLLQPHDLMPATESAEKLNTPEQVSDSEVAINLATNGFGVGHWHLINGDRQRAREVFEAVTKGNSQAAFGFIAAEVELQRLQDVETIPPQIYAGFKGYSRIVTCNSPEAQQWFAQGIQLLYGFNHDEAIRSFQKAAEIDPGCAMAWWGSAYARGLHINNPEMTEIQSRLAREDTDKAMAALDDESPVERTLVEALTTRYQWPAPEDRTALDQAFAGAMERAWHLFPNDPDVSALYAESLMNLQPWDLWTGEGKPKGRALEIAAVLQKTLLDHPNHPGANHFYIHAIEASPWPELGIPAAERLLNLVPGSGHLVHMPSHIFIRVGRYAEAVDANERAIAADEAYFANAPPPNFYNVYFLHNVHFLAYAAMMEGRFEVSISAARKIERLIPEAFLREYVTLADGFMPTTLHVLIRFGKWEAILQEQEPPDWRLFSRAQRHYARCIALANLGRIDAAEDELKLLNRVTNQMDESWVVGNNKAIDVIEIGRCMAEGEMAFHAGDFARAYERLRAGVRLEDQLAYDEPPGWMQPVRHALGALLLAGNKLEEAELVYRTDLTRHPKNAWSLLGLQQALQKQGKQTEVDAMAESVKTAWARADVTPNASCYCHPEANR
jgi:tetratricopeptide (TPR) repeat protein